MLGNVTPSYLDSKDHSGKADGSDPFEIFALMFVTPTIFLLPSMLNCLYGTSKFKYIKNIFVLNASLMLILTIFNSLFYMVFIACVSISVFLLKTTYKKIESLPSTKSSKTSTWKKFMNKDVYFSHNNIPYLDDLRGHLLHTTAICILAVDFQIFPSKYSKTETYGFSIMDVGVGLFVAVHALFSPEAKGKATSLKQSFSDSFELLIIGMLRLIAVTAVGYHTAVSEYGVHWNFFFTLSLTKIISTCLSTYCARLKSWFIGVTMAIGYQSLLSTGMTEYIFQKERVTLLDKNKEGVFSVIGFVVIYFGCVEIGKMMWKSRKKFREYVNLLGVLLLLWLLGIATTFVIHNIIQPTSRRMANSAYCLWVISLLCLQIAIHLFHTIILFLCLTAGKITNHNTFEDIPSIGKVEGYFLWKAINSNGLLYFLLANIFTGLTNLSIETSKTSTTMSYFVLVIYISALTEIIKSLYAVAPKFKLRLTNKIK